MIRLFTGYDPRETVGWHVFAQSLIDTTREMVSVHTMTGKQRDGTNAFTYERFMIPEICEYSGFALFMDGADMLLRADLSELWDMKDEQYAVQVVKHDYKTAHPRKYMGTHMEAENHNYARKNWSSVVLWNCGHPANKFLSRKIVDKCSGGYLHTFSWLKNEAIGEIPAQWNVLVGEQVITDEDKLRHFTLGIPSFPRYWNCDGSQEWHETRSRSGV